MTKIIIADSVINCDHLLGTFLDENHYDVLVEEDCDFYAPINCDLSIKSTCEKTCSECDIAKDEQRVVFKFRKNWFTTEQQKEAYEGLYRAARETNNRGLASGPRVQTEQIREFVKQEQLDILEVLSTDRTSLYNDTTETVRKIQKEFENKEIADSRGSVWLEGKKDKDWNFNSWVDSVLLLSRDEQRVEANRIAGWISDTTYANIVNSGIAGWYDRFPRFPYGRPTSYNRDNFSLFQKSYPFLQSLSEGFKQLLPNRFERQMKAIRKLDSRFHVPETPFTTITVNKTFRTAAHRDAGDLAEGFSNLSVITNGKSYTGGYLILPEFRAAINIRPGDLLLVGNHEWIHGNTPIEVEEGGERVSLVCYFREGMSKLGNYDYEMLRYNFIEERRKNKEHPLWWSKWNGVSPNCFSDHPDSKQDWEATKEWYEYLKANGEIWLDEYHPWLRENFESIGLDAFFV